MSSIAFASRQARRAGAVATVALTLAAAGLVGAGHADADRSTDSGTAYVRTAHLSPDTPKVDVYLTAFRGGSTKLFVKDVGYGDASSYHRMTAGQYAVSMRPAGAARTSPAALSWTVDLRPGRSYTAAAIGEQAKLHGIVFADAAETPTAGKGLVRVVQAADQADQMSVTADGTTVGTALSFGSVSNYVSVPAGKVTVAMKIPSQPSLNGSKTLQVNSRSAVTVLLLDMQGGGIEARPLVDIAGPQRMPTGAVPAGGGGTAGNSATAGSGLTAVVLGLGGVLLALAVGAGTLTTARRRRSAAA